MDEERKQNRTNVTRTNPGSGTFGLMKSACQPSRSTVERWQIKKKPKSINIPFPGEVECSTMAMLS